MEKNKMKVILFPNLEPPFNLRQYSFDANHKKYGGATEDEVIDSILRQEIKRGLIKKDSYWVVDSADLPPDRDFFNAWEWDDGATVNMTKARAIHLDSIRVVRNAELAAKDITFMRAVEAGDTDAQAIIAIEKQVLRDIPQTFDLTTDNDTPEELKAKWPVELPERE
jgi:hypothetical protein